MIIILITFIKTIIIKMDTGYEQDWEPNHPQENVKLPQLKS